MIHVGDSPTVLHSCWGMKDGHDTGATIHTTPITVTEITNTTDGRRLRGTRCDGTPIEWIEDIEGEDR